MKKATPPKTDEPPPFNRFKDLTRKLVTVPKKEIDAKEVAYQRERDRKKKGR
jgi:hypothetical protein